MKADLAEIEIIKCWVTAGDKASTLHKVSTVGEVDGVEVILPQKQMNHPFDYAGGDIIAEGMASLIAYLEDPATL